MKHPRTCPPAGTMTVAIVLVVMLVSGGPRVAAAEDLFLFRGEFIYIIPRALSDEMTRLAGRGEWKHFPEHTRYLDQDADGDAEFLAAAFGAKGGYGAQVRYRLRRGPDGERRLGRWYWGAIVGPGGERVLEQFNP